MRKSMLAFLVASLFAANAFAQTSAQAADTTRAGGQGSHTVSYKDRTDYTFGDDEEVIGTLVSPDVEVITSRTKTHHTSLVQPRKNFHPELLQSVEFL